MKTNPYVFFDGDCRAAFSFYEKVLGATVLMMSSYADAPEDVSPDGEMEGCAAGDTPVSGPEMADRIMHGRLEVGGTIIMASDAPEGRFEKPAGFTLNVDTESPAEAERVFAALSEGGAVTMPMAETFWAERFGMVTDRFGMPWMVNCERPMPA